MGIFKRLFAESTPASLFSVVFPQASAGLQIRQYLKAYRGWMYACIRAITTGVGTIEFQLQKKSAAGWAEVKIHPPFEGLATARSFTTTDGLYRATSSHIDLTGNAFWYVAYNGRGVLIEFSQLHPTKVDVAKIQLPQHAIYPIADQLYEMDQFSRAAVHCPHLHILVPPRPTHRQSPSRPLDAIEHMF